MVSAAAPERQRQTGDSSTRESDDGTNGSLKPPQAMPPRGRTRVFVVYGNLVSVIAGNPSGCETG